MRANLLFCKDYIAPPLIALLQFYNPRRVTGATGSAAGIVGGQVGIALEIELGDQSFISRVR